MQPGANQAVHGKSASATGLALRRMAGIVLFACSALVVVYLLVAKFGLYGIERRFDARAWKAQSDDHPVRLSMVRDLMRTHELVGMSSTDVSRLLGSPLAGDHKFSDHGLVYWLGHEKGLFPLDSEWLLLDLSVDGKVKEVHVTSD